MIPSISKEELDVLIISYIDCIIWLVSSLISYRSQSNYTEQDGQRERERTKKKQSMVKDTTVRVREWNNEIFEKDERLRVVDDYIVSE